jgi:tRNA-splicing ligase RtcB (3'-phosphate/5'-hydroxy nucleic acid ligase)
MSNLDKLKTLIPMEEIEQGAQQQIYALLDLDFVKKLAIMPDVHMGYLMPIGGVGLFDNVISPYAVGYDIGCGMCNIITDTPYEDIVPQRDIYYQDMTRQIPLGFNGHSARGKRNNNYKVFASAIGNAELDEKVNNKLNEQLGTLGSGNHFIEIGETSQGLLAITIHSGSRNIGHSIATAYIKLSKEYDTDLPKDFLHLNSIVGQAYLKDMNFALEYALDNRLHMMVKLLEIFNLPVNTIKDVINENHNHAEVLEDGMVLHRKGATPALKGQLGIIPGSMKTGVYITEGLGNYEYLNSASHGAGRKMSRKKAKENIDLDKFEKDMEGIMAPVHSGTLDEAPDAYKDLHYVIGLQEGKVIKIIDHIKPKIVVKG